MDYEIHEQILLYLFQHRNSGQMHDLLQGLHGVERSIISDKALELQQRGYIETKFPFPGVGSLDWNTGEVEWHGAENDDYIKAKISTDGIDYVKSALLNRNHKPKVKVEFKKETINILVGIFVIVTSALILYYLFGIKP